MVGRVIRAPFARLDPGVGLLVVALAFGLLTALLTLSYLQRSSTVTAVTDSLVVVARADIRAGEKIQPSAIELITVPANEAGAGSFSATADVVCRVARTPVQAGEQVLAGELVDRKTDDALAYSVPAGYRAVSVPFSAVMGAGGLVVPGDRVDVLVYTEYANLRAGRLVR
jgi:pilus assembly protein CpaB